MSDDAEIVTLSSRIAYENRWLRLREDIIRRRDGSDGLYGVVERADFVVVAAVEDGSIALVEQYRYPIRERMVELPMGMWEERPDADPMALAAGELREETGLIAGRLTRAGILYQGAGYSTQKGHVFLATDLSQGTQAREQTEQDMTSFRVSVDEMAAMIADGRITCAVSIAAFGMLRAKGLL